MDFSDSSPKTFPEVLEARRRFLAAVNLDDASVITLRQVHSTRVHTVKEASSFQIAPEGDALITDVPQMALGVKGADCLPVLIADPDRLVVGAVHCGWRGTLAGVLPATIHEMQKEFGCDPQALWVAIGPGIRPCCFEVGDEVAAPFVNAYPEIEKLVRHAERHPGKCFLDLPLVLNAQMDRLGISRSQRRDSGACSCCNARDFHSYRRDGMAAGRMMAVIGICGSLHRKLRRIR